MDLRQLRSFLRVVESGSVSKAAARLGVTQPAIGLQIRTLEDRLGVQLLFRHARGMRPTEAGLTLAERARRILDDVERAQREVRESSTVPRGDVTLGITASIGIVLVPPLLEHVRRTLPEVALTLVEGVSEAILRGIAEDRLTIGLSGMRRESDDLAFEPLLSEPLMFIGRARDPLARPGPIAFGRVADLPLVLPKPTHPIRQIVDATGREVGRRLAVAIELDSVSLKKELILGGGGYTILPYTAVHREIGNGDLFARPIARPRLIETLFLVRAARYPERRAASALRLLIRSLVDEAIAARRWRWRPPAP